MATRISPAFVGEEAGYREFLARCPDGVWCVELADPLPVTMPATDAADLIARTARVTSANDAAATLLGRPRGSDLIGQRLGGLLVQDASQLRELLTEFVIGDFRLPAQLLRIATGCGGGSLVHTLTGIVEDGALVRIWGVQRPAAGGVDTAEPFHHVQKMAVIGRVATSVAHDFNNLLTAIIGYGEMVNDALTPGTASHRDMQHVLGAAARAEALTRQLLTFGRRQQRHPEAFDLSLAVREMEPLLRRLMPDEVEVVLETAGVPAMVHGDRGQLELAVINLAINARDAMPRGGQLSIATSLDVQPGDSQTGPVQVRLSVTDTGMGMVPAVRARLFEPFFTTKAGGVGLGLATVQAIVTQNRGRVEVGSGPGGGAAFTIVLAALGYAGHAVVPAGNVSRMDTFRARREG